MLNSSVFTSLWVQMALNKWSNFTLLPPPTITGLPGSLWILRNDSHQLRKPSHIWGSGHLVNVKGNLWKWYLALLPTSNIILNLLKVPSFIAFRAAKSGGAEAALHFRKLLLVMPSHVVLWEDRWIIPLFLTMSSCVPLAPRVLYNVFLGIFFFVTSLSGGLLVSKTQNILFSPSVASGMWLAGVCRCGRQQGRKVEKQKSGPDMAKYWFWLSTAPLHPIMWITFNFSYGGKNWSLLNSLTQFSP